MSELSRRVLEDPIPNDPTSRPWRVDLRTLATEVERLEGELERHRMVALAGGRLTRSTFEQEAENARLEERVKELEAVAKAAAGFRRTVYDWWPQIDHYAARVYIITQGKVLGDALHALEEKP